MAITDVGIRLSAQGDQQVINAMQGIEKSVDRLVGGLAKVGHYGAAFIGIQAGLGGMASGFIKAADAVTMLNNQLKLATGSTQAAAKAYESLFEIAQRSRVSFTELGGTFASISRAGAELGISQQRLLGVTEALSNAMAIGGGSAESTRAALVQLGQGMASGVLRGEELNSVMEQTPRLAKALADGLGVSTGELRKMGEQGQITAERVIKALESQSAVLKGEVADSVITVGQAWTQLTNASTKAIGEIDKATGASASLAGSMQNLAGFVGSVGQAFKEHEAAITVTLGLIAGAATAVGIGAVAVRVGALATSMAGLAGGIGLVNAALALNPVTLALLGIGAVVGGAAVAVNAYRGSISGLSSEVGNLAREIERLQKLQGGGGIDANDPRIAAQIVKLQASRKAAQEALSNKLVGEQGDYPEVQIARAAAEKALKVQEDAAEKSLNIVRLSINKELSIRTDGAKKAADINTAFQNSIAAADRAGDSSRAASLEKERVAALLASVAETGKAVKALNAKNKESNSEHKQFLDERLRLSRQAVIDDGKALDDANDAFQKALQKNAQALLDAQVAAATAANKELSALRDANEAQRLQNETIGLTVAQMDALVLKRMDLTIATQEGVVAEYADVAAMDVLNGTRNANLELMQREIDKLAELKKARGLTAVGQEVTRQSEGEKKTLEAGKRVGEQLENLVTDGLMRGFEAGKTIAENFRDTLTNVFKTMILRPTIQATVAGGLSAVGLPAAAQAAGGGANLFATGGAFASSAFGMGMQGTIATIAEQGFVAGFGNAMTSASALASAGSFTGAVGAALPYVGAALVAIAVLDKLLSKGEYISGKTSNLAFDAQGNQTGRNVREAYNVTDGGAQTDQVVQGIIGSYFSAAQRLGIQAKGINVGFETTTAGTFGVGATVGGSQVFDSGETKYSQEALGLAASRAVFAALQSSELPGYLSKAFDGVVAGTASQAQIDSVFQFAENLKAVRFGLLDASAQAVEYQKVIDAGTVSLGTSAATFRKDFVAAIDAGLTQEGLANWQTLGAALDGLAQVAGNAATSVSSAASWEQKIALLRDKSLQTSYDLQRDLAAVTDEATKALIRQYYAQVSLRDATNAAASAQSAYDSALGAVQSIVGQATDAYTAALDRLNAAKRQMLDMASSLQEFIDRQRNPNASKNEFASIAAAAQGGDSVALGKLSAAAQTAIDAAQASAGTAAEFASAKNRILAEVQKAADKAKSLGAGAPAVPNELSAAQAAVDAAKTVAQTIGAPLTRAADSLVAQYRAAVDAANRAGADAIEAQLKQADAQLVLEKIELNTREKLTGVTDTNGRLAIDLKVSAESEIRRTLTLIEDTAGVSAETRAIILGASNTAAKIISMQLSTDPATLAVQTQLLNIANVGNKSINLTLNTASLATYTQDVATAVQATNQLANLVLTGKDQYSADVLATLAGIASRNSQNISLAITQASKDGWDATVRSALAASGSIAQAVQLVATGYDTASQALIAASTGALQRSVSLVLGNNDATAASILAAQSATITKTLNAAGGVLTADQRTLITAITNYQNAVTTRTLDLNFTFDRTKLTDLQTLLQSIFGTYDLSRILASGNGDQVKDVIGGGTVDRLTSINTQIQAKNWNTDRDGKIRNTLDLFDTASFTSLNASREEIANATGQLVADVNQLVAIADAIKAARPIFANLSDANFASNAQAATAMRPRLEQAGVTVDDLIKFSGVSNANRLRGVFDGLNLNQMTQAEIDAGAFDANTAATAAGRTGADHTDYAWQFIYDKMKGEGYSLSQADARIGNTMLSDFVARKGLPAFAIGTNYLPSDMVAQVHQGERIIPAADNRELMQRLASPQQNNEVLVSEIRALREEVRRLREESGQDSRTGNANTKRTADILANVTQGNPYLFTKAAT